MEMTGGTWRMVVAMGLSGTIGAFVLLSGQPPLTVVVFRCVIGAVALLGYLWCTSGWKPMDWRALGWTAAGGAALVGNWLCLFSAFALSGITITTVIYHVQPFLLLILAAIVQRELPSWRKLPFFVLAFAGVALTTGMDADMGQPGLLRGVLLALAAAFLYALATLATRKLAAHAPAQIAGVQLALGALVLAPMANMEMGKLNAAAWSSLVIVGLVHTGLVYNLMYGAFQRLRAETIANLSFIYPAVALATDVALFELTLGALQWLGVALILLSVLANQRIGATPAKAGPDPQGTIRTRPGPSGRHGSSA